jgi:hypothetical protein
MSARAIASGQTDAAFEAQYPKLAQMLARAGADPDLAQRERTIALAERLLELATSQATSHAKSESQATNDAGLAIFEACAPDSVYQKVRAAMDLRSRDEGVARAQDAQVEALAAQMRAASKGPAGPHGPHRPHGPVGLVGPHGPHGPHGPVGPHGPAE